MRQAHEPAQVALGQWLMEAEQLVGSPDGLRVGLLVAAGIFLVLLALNEHLCAGLRWGREIVR